MNFQKNTSSRRDLLIPDDWTIGQYGAYNPLFPLLSNVRCESLQRTFRQMASPRISQQLKKYDVSDYTAKCERVR